jgi:hypothetical protein
LTPGTHGKWEEKVLRSFWYFSNKSGDRPYAGLVFDPTGNLYGTTGFRGSGSGAGCDSIGCGTVFEITP